MSFVVSITSNQGLLLQRKNDPQVPNTIMVKIQFANIGSLLESGCIYCILEGKKTNKTNTTPSTLAKETTKNP